MNRRELIVGVSALAAPLAACGAVGGVATVRFKVIARAQLDGKDYEGFAVNELRARYTPNTLSGFQMSRTLKGEATVVDFAGKADALFVLLTDYLEVLLRLWEIAPSPGSADETTIPKLKAATGSKEFPLVDLSRLPAGKSYVGMSALKNLFPRIAAFRNEGDPATVYQVNPDDLAKTHGVGARFIGLSVEIVDSKTPLTNEIQNRLGWLDPSSGQTIDPLPPGGLPSGSATFGQVVGHGAFKSES